MVIAEHKIVLRLISLISSSVLLVSCASTQGGSVSDATPEQRQAVIDTYHCVWYFHVAGNEELSQELIDKAVTDSENLGLDPGSMMQLYSVSRQTQRQEIEPLAIEIAGKRAPAVPQIMAPKEGEGSGLQPNDEDMSEAIRQLYADRCQEKFAEET